MSRITYRAEIDGLRAVAVLAVVLFHAGLGCSGGYIGVDVFFVISGFLITSLIWRDLERGNFSFSLFWERRARRIVPALLVVTIVCLAVGWFLLLPADLMNLGQASAAQAVFAANFHYWGDAGYFSAAVDEKPLLHTWSLAVEEQFYFLVPLLLWGIYRGIVTLNRRRAAYLLLALGSTGSFLLSVYTVERYPSATFYLLPTRAWELALGSLVAFAPAVSPERRYRVFIELCSWLGLALVIIPAFAYGPETTFPGIAALPPCLGASLLIWANTGYNNRVPTVAGRLLTLPLLVWIGLISYSLYLWHWPLFAFAKYVALGPLSLSLRLVLVIAGFVCAIISWKYVETPFRKRQFAASRRAMLTSASAGLVMVLALGGVCLWMDGFPRRLPAKALALSEAKLDRSFIRNVPIEDVTAEKLLPVGVTQAGESSSVLVWGDSHAMAALPAIDAYLKENGMSGKAVTYSSTPPVLGWFKKSTWGLGKDSIAFNEAVFGYIKKHQVSEVMLIARWDSCVSDHSGLQTIRSALLKTVSRLVAINARPWVLLDVPGQPFDVPKAVARSFLSQVDISLYSATPAVYTALYPFDDSFVAEMENAGARILDPRARFLDESGERYIVQTRDVVLYRDDHHLSSDGAKHILLPFLRENLKLQSRPMSVRFTTD